MEKVNLAQKLATFSDCWQPRTVGEFNGHDLMVVKVKGEFNWHSHADTDDFFLVLKGWVTIQLRDRNVELARANCSSCPREWSIAPMAAEEAHILLIEPSGTPNTGDRATAAERRVI